MEYKNVDVNINVNINAEKYRCEKYNRVYII